MKKLIVVGMMLASTAHAEFKDGNKLLADLTDSNATLIAPSVGLGYILGVTDAFTKTSICIPNNVQAGQVQDVVKNYLYAHPELRQYSADSLVLEAVKAVWPCARGRTSL